MPKIEYSRLATEQINPRTRAIDTMSLPAIAAKINAEDQKIHSAVKKQLPAIALAARIVAETIAQNKKIFFIGAGTSGRLAVLEAAECPPTFHTKPSQIQAIMAGGKKAVFESQEGAEDNAREGRRQISKKARPGDAVVGIAASGVTPFVLSAMKEASKRGCRAILVTCNSKLKTQNLKLKTDAFISADTGPEVIAGSTRMKAGTATKMILNMITTAAMVKLGKVYDNRMVDLQIKSKKLRERAIGLVGEFTGLGRDRAIHSLAQAHGSVKVAILMARTGVSRQQALRMLNQCAGSLRRALDIKEVRGER